MTSPTPCCPEYAAVTRRGLFRGVALAGVTTVVGSAVVTTSPAQALAPAKSVLVVLSLRGAADGLSLVVPYTDPVYYAARPKIAIPADRLLARNGTFGLHPRLSALVPLWTAGKVAAIHATGLPVANRSHFAAMEAVEDANPGSTTRQGWLNRLIGSDATRSPLEGFHLGRSVVPTSLYGPQPVMAADRPDGLSIPAGDQRGRTRSLHTLWDSDRSPLGRGMRSAFEAVNGFGPVQDAADRTSSYPATDLGKALAQVARVVRGDVGTEVITVDQGEWDHHNGLGTLEWGSMRDNAQELATAVAAFFGDLGPHTGKVTMVVLSEFGRRVQENANFGLDHGHGNVMLAIGAGVKGGYYASWPGLTNTSDADLRVTTDYRNVLADVVQSRFGASIPRVFPGLKRKRVGFMQGV
ncbi:MULTISPECIES: DUF1501 domain-containing protein [unclassified Nocardioides]|uniref:DUF1501 domain-containing protein n=1 Tax=unclassified Nocardioides TaxID=2615069 RepID=UPI0030157110